MGGKEATTSVEDSAAGLLRIILSADSSITGKFLDFNLIRVVIMPHVKREHLSQFAIDLEKFVKKLKL